MKRVFDFGRFSNYLKYDLNNLRTNYGLSLMLISVLPVLMYVAFFIIHLILGGEWGNWALASIICSIIAATLAMLFSLPKNLYGKLTEKKEGSAWILVPASTFEKFLSMMVVLLLVVPVIFFVIYVASSGLIALIDPLYKSFIFESGSGIHKLLEESPITFSGFSLGASTWINWAENILAFTLGAICFKKSKNTKTLLCCFAFGIVCIFLSSVFFHTMSFNEDDIESLIENFSIEKLQFWFNFVINIINAVLLAALCGGIYWRLRTIKH